MEKKDNCVCCDLEQNLNKEIIEKHIKQKCKILKGFRKLNEKELGLSQEKIEMALKELAKDNIIHIRYEISCPNCLHQIKMVNDKTPIVCTCIYCGEEFEPFDNLFSPYYEIDKEFKKNCLQKKEL